MCVAELAWVRDPRSFVHGVRELPARVSLLDNKGTLLARWGSVGSGTQGHVSAPHGICADSHGDVYVGEVNESVSHGGPLPPGCHALQKFARASQPASADRPEAIPACLVSGC